MYCEVQILFLKYCLLRSAIRKMWMYIRKKWQVHINMLYVKYISYIHIYDDFEVAFLFRYMHACTCICLG